ncbi:MAG: NTP transferase domain-containing protein [Arenimonas sp.]
MSTRDQITLGILAGGLGQRLGGADKAFVNLHGQTLLARTLEVMGEGYAQVLVSHNRADPRIAQSGASAVADLRADFPGPLAGIEAMLHAASSRWLLTVPVDLREVPPQLPERLLQALVSPAGHDGIVVADVDGLQPLVALWPVAEARIATTRALNAGELAVHRLIELLRFAIHDVSPLRLGNLNAPADFE